MIRQDNLTPETIQKINAFWNWFQKNEFEIIKAIEILENYEEVLSQLNKKLKSISSKLGFVIMAAENPNDQHTIIFTSHGNRTLFGKVKGLKQYAPDLKNWITQAFIKPAEDTQIFNQSLEDSYVFRDVEIKTSDLYFSILDYNLHKKKLKIIIYLKNYCFHFDNHFREEAIYIIVENLIGEIALKKHITLVQLAQLPENPKNLIHLVELQHYIDKLNSIHRKGM